MERRDVYENELTEEDRPPAAEREDVSQTERLDPEPDSDDSGDTDMKDNIYGMNEKP